MGAQFDCLRYEVFQNLFLSPMNTGLLRPAVATVPTVYGIETRNPFGILLVLHARVATVPTVYGIETMVLFLLIQMHLMLQQYLPFTVLKQRFKFTIDLSDFIVATVPTVYGIETQSGM